LLLNEAERMYCGTLKKLHGNAKYAYPFWKVCQVCSKVYPTHDKAQAAKKKTCSKKCANKAVSLKNTGQRVPPEQSTKVQITCPVCGRKKWKPRAWVKRVKVPVCSRSCNGVLRGREWKKHAHKGRAGWTDASLKSYREKMSGPNNPAWKGGVTYFDSHGNYPGGLKYVRCPDDFLPMARKDGYVVEHRLVVAQAIGRPLKRSEVVHHVDHDPHNNDLGNLQLFASNRDHKLHEHHGYPFPIWRGSNPSGTKGSSGA